MKVLYLPKEENTELIKELSYEYIKETYLSFIHSLVDVLVENNYVTNEDKDQYTKLGIGLMYGINKIILNDIYRYIATNNLSVLLTMVSSNLYGSNVYINRVYVIDIMRDILKIDELNDNYLAIENILTKKISYYINKVYCNNSDNLNVIFIKLIDMFMTNCVVGDNKGVRFELFEGNRPVLFIQE